MKEKTFEQALSRIEEISESLESGQQSLDDSVKLFEEVNELAKFCGKQLGQAEKKLQILVKDDGGLSTIDGNID